jgi:carboxypeptidase family protein/TonB-dependent receptor-like protein
MTPQRWFAVLALFWALLPAGGADAQVLTGSITGTVRDDSGGVLPGATVRASSPAIIGGAVAATTDERGVFRLPSLAPGEYALDIELASFAGYRENGIRVDVQSNIERSITLQIAGVAESVSVEGGSAVDAQRAGLASRFDLQELKAIPVRRFSMFDFIKAAPGVSPTSPTSGTDPSVSVFGSGGNESLYLLDGTNFTCPCSGGPQPQPDVDVIEEVHVDSVGASAEFGNIQGAVFNVVTKQGGNVFAPDFSYYGQTKGLTSQPVQLPCVRCSEPTTEYTRVQYRDLTTHLGGPLIPSRVWFFGGYQYLRDSDSQPGTDPLFPRVSEYDKGFAKVTWQIAPRLKWMSSLHDERLVTPQRPTLAQPFETTLNISGTRPTTTFGQVSDTISNDTLLDVRVSRFSMSSVNDPSTGDRTTPNRLDLATGVQSGGPQGFGGGTLFRTTVAGSLSHYHSFLASAHDLKLGMQIEHGGNTGWTAFQAGVVNYTDNAGQPVQATFRQPSTSGGEFLTTGLYAMDTVRFADRFTVSLGLRFDHDRATSQSLPAHDALGNEVGAAIGGLGALYSWSVFSPRLGFTVKLTEDGRTVFRASYGRFHQGILTGELNPVHPGVTPITTAAFDAATGQYSRVISVVDPTVNLRLDPDMKSPLTNQLGIGVDREFARHTSFTISYVRKDGRDFIGWTDTGGLYRPDARTLSDGRIVPVFVLANGTGARRFLMTNPSDYYLRYNGLTTAFEKRWSGGWQALASYTLSKTEGLQPSSGGPAGSGQASSTFGGNTFGRDPNTLTNASGLLGNDRTHVFRAMGSVGIPKTGFVLAGNLQCLTGSPWAASTQVSLPQGLTRILLETPGTRRLSSQTLLDLRLSHVFDLPHKGRVEVLVDILNALNQTSEERLADDNYFSQNFARPSVFVDPRRAMLGARLTF